MAAAVIRIAGMAVIAVSAVQILRQCRPELAVYAVAKEHLLMFLRRSAEVNFVPPAMM